MPAATEELLGAKPSENGVSGRQEPRLEWIPPHDRSYGERALNLAEDAGLRLDAWQQRILLQSLNVRGEKWAAEEIGVVCPRQNGKNEILVARELAGLFLFDERLILHSAHQNDTALEGFRRLLDVIEATPKLDKEVRKINRAAGVEGLELHNGRRIRFATRNRGGRKGFSVDLVIMDEAMELPEVFFGSLRPVVSARPNSQIWLTGSAVDQMVHKDGIVLARVRERGLSEDPDLFYSEWSIDCEDRMKVTEEMTKDEELWAFSNPAYGKRIDDRTIEAERRSMGIESFLTERLGVGDWPRTDGLAGAAITPEQWGRCIDKQSEAQDPVCFAFDITPDRSRASVVVAGFRSDELAHVEIIEQRRQTGWIPDFIAGLLERHEGSIVVTDASALDSSLLTDLEKFDVRFGEKERGLLVNATEMARACGMLYDAVEQKTMRHLGEPALSDAIRCAVKRPLSDAWAWDRRSTAGDISPLVAVTLAHWGLQGMELDGPQFWDLADFEEDDDEVSEQSS